jgi:crotonobetainyl-CoA:carnitine CoA-transferase CaiB-like acyl-CoA transferase
LLIERPDLIADESLALFPERRKRWEWWNETVHAYTRTQPTADLIERASALRIPVAPVNDGKRVLEHPHLIERGVYIEDPSGGFQRPVAPYLVDGERPAPPRPAPRLGEHEGRIEAQTPQRPSPKGERRLPLDGVRVLDLTAWWAGPASTHMLATLGADVIHVEAIQRLDGMRMVGGIFIDRPSWWELSLYFLASNANKRGITLNLGDERGLEVLQKLIERSDVIVENYSPRVMDAFGVTSERIRELNPRAVYIRMPAFGLDGPWRDNVGFAQTMEQMSGMAWVTGWPEDQPRIPGGPCDPLAGMHAAFTALVGLANRETTGHGSHFECAMIEGALNAAAEQVIEYTAYGKLLEREGNRAPEAAPQGLYPCQGVERWLAISVCTDAQWEALKDVLGGPAWAEVPGLASHHGRRAQQDLLDEHLGAWAATCDVDAAAEQLIAAGVPAARMVDARLSGDHPQLVARGFAESAHHPVAGDLPIPTVPFRYASVEHWTRRPAPLLGEHNEEILAELGYSAEAIAALREAEVIGEHPKGL